MHHLARTLNNPPKKPKDRAVQSWDALEIQLAHIVNTTVQPQEGNGNTTLMIHRRQPLPSLGVKLSTSTSNGCDGTNTFRATLPVKAKRVRRG